MSEIDISQFINQKLPPEILEQLKVFSRVQFPMKPTIASAISSIDDNTQKATDDLNKTIDHVKNMEDICKQIEDSIDLLTKDMNIPPANDTIAKAAKKLGSPDGNITKDIMDKAMAIIDYFPAFNGLGDPVLGALTGDPSINGNKWMECDEITSSLASQFIINTSEVKVNTPISERTTETNEAFEQKQQNMMIEMLQMLFWNMLWPKYLVDTNLNTIRSLVANPLDALILFFKSFPFKKPSQKKVRNEGPINKLINNFRKFLLCVVPPKAYPRYQPPLDIDCSTPDCTPATDIKDDPDRDKLEDIKDPTSSVLSDNPCAGTTDEFFRDSKLENQNPPLFGASPECTKAAKVVLDAILSDALTAPGGSSVPTFLNDGFQSTIGGI